MTAMILRFTQKLSTRIKAGPLATEPLAANPYTDWSVRIFTADARAAIPV